MTSSLLEATRRLHQDLEKYERQAVMETLTEPRNHREIMTQTEKVQRYLEMYNETAKKVLDVYDDKDGARKQELESMTGPDVFDTFMSRLNDIRDYHRRFPEAAQSASEDVEVKAVLDFNAEEAYGKYVDLHPFHKRFINMQQFGKRRIAYHKYLELILSDYFFNVPLKHKLGPNLDPYQSFIGDMLKYLLSFHRRAFPLVSHDTVLKMIDEEFESDWNANKVPGWANATKDKSDPLFCSACQRTFAKQTVFDAHLNGKKHKKRAALIESGKEAVLEKKDELTRKSLAQLEYRLKYMCVALKPVIEATQEYVEQLQTMTYEEIAAEKAADERDFEEEIVEDDSDSGEEGAIYNPHNVPLGWDGKPIPYWLYKLHGLNIEYKCEICGNFSYWGPRAFQRHFSEARHNYGMRCLGIPNTKHFQNVTLIEDAMTLHEKIKKLSTNLAWRADDEEEFEDEQGNVFNKKTYEDLKRQGLVK